MIPPNTANKIITGTIRYTFTDNDALLKHNNTVNSVISNTTADARAKINLDFFTDDAVINAQKNDEIPAQINTKIKNRSCRISFLRITKEQIDVEIIKQVIPAIKPLRIPFKVGFAED